MPDGKRLAPPPDTAHARDCLHSPGRISNSPSSPCYQPFEKSQLYSSKEEAKFIDEDKRRSRFRAIVDSELFDLCGGLPFPRPDI